jgi:hypothetical protein
MVPAIAGRRRSVTEFLHHRGDRLRPDHRLPSCRHALSLDRCAPTPTTSPSPPPSTSSGHCCWAARPPHMRPPQSCGAPASSPSSPRSRRSDTAGPPEQSTTSSRDREPAHASQTRQGGCPPSGSERRGRLGHDGENRSGGAHSVRHGGATQEFGAFLEPAVQRRADDDAEAWAAPYLPSR